MSLPWYNIQIIHKVVIYWGNKLYLHPFDHFEGRRPKTGKSDVIQFIDSVDNKPSVLFGLYYFLNIK